MVPGDSFDDEQWDSRARHETETERLDRNWGSLLQELRVVQTGVQLLTGFLLTLPFQQRFDVLDDDLQLVYLATVAASVCSTILLVAPVGMHRLLFRKHRLPVLVAAAHRCAYAGLVLLGLALTGMIAIIFEVVAGRPAAIVAGSCALVLFALFWFGLPLAMRLSGRSGEGQQQSGDQGQQNQPGHQRDCDAPGTAGRHERHRDGQ